MYTTTPKRICLVAVACGMMLVSCANADRAGSDNSLSALRVEAVPLGAGTQSENVVAPQVLVPSELGRSITVHAGGVDPVSYYSYSLLQAGAGSGTQVDMGHASVRYALTDWSGATVVHDGWHDSDVLNLSDGGDLAVLIASQLEGTSKGDIVEICGEVKAPLVPFSGASVLVVENLGD